MLYIKMFIQDGKTLFGNTGLLISIIILILLLLVGYRKCYLTNNSNNSNNNVIEMFNNNTPGSLPITLQYPSNVRLILDKNNVIVRFTVNKNGNNKYPNNFFIILAQYNSEKQPTGNNLFNVTNEYLLNSTISLTENSINTNACSIINGVPSCQYRFDNVDVRDPVGNLYYYKLGICSVFDGINSEIITPENILSTDKMFTLESTLDKQNQLNKNFIEYTNAIKTNKSYNNTMSTADGDYELIKKQLGNYPDSLFLNNEFNNQDSLADLVNKSMALGKINVKID